MKHLHMPDTILFARETAMNKMDKNKKSRPSGNEGKIK